MKSISIFIFFKNISLVRRSFKRHILKSILTVFFSAGWHLMPNMIKVQNISRNQLAGKQWCCPKNVPSVIRRQDSGYWDCRCSQHHRLKLKREGHCNTFGSSFKVTKKKKRHVGAFLGFVETSQCASGEGWHRVSFTAGPGLMALTASCSGVLVCYTGVWRIRRLFEEFIVFQHALLKRHDTEKKLNNKKFFVVSEAIPTNDVFPIGFLRRTVTEHMKQVLHLWQFGEVWCILWCYVILTVRFWIPSEKAPICLTVPSESSICETTSSFQTQTTTDYRNHAANILKSPSKHWWQCAHNKKCIKTGVLSPIITLST